MRARHSSDNASGAQIPILWLAAFGAAALCGSDVPLERVLSILAGVGGVGWLVVAVLVHRATPPRRRLEGEAALLARFRELAREPSVAKTTLPPQPDYQDFIDDGLAIQATLPADVRAALDAALEYGDRPEPLWARLIAPLAVIATAIAWALPPEVGIPLLLIAPLAAKGEALRLSRAATATVRRQEWACRRLEGALSQPGGVRAALVLLCAAEVQAEQGGTAFRAFRRLLAAYDRTSGAEQKVKPVGGRRRLTAGGNRPSRPAASLNGASP
jgi:hypothetical protein